METKNSPVRWLIVLFFTLFMAFMTYNLIVFPACAPDTMQTYGIGQQGLTTLTSVTSVVGVFTGLIFGRMLDTKDVRKTVMLFLFIGVVLFFARAFAASYALVAVLTFLASASVGVCQVASPKVLNSWFPPQNVGTALSFLTAGAGIGSAGGFALGAFLSLHQSLLCIGGAYLVLLILWAVIGREGPYQMAPPQAAEQPKGDAKAVFRSKGLWCLTLAYGLAVSCSLLVNSYMINAFISKGFDPSQASMVGTALNLALMIGGFAMTGVLGAAKRFNILLAISMLGGGAFVLLGWFAPIGVVTWVSVALGGFFFGGSLGLCVGRIPLITLTGQFGPELIATASGFSETIKGIISFLFPIVVTAALGTNFNGIFIVFAIACVLCILFGSVLIPEVGENGKLYKKLHTGQKAAKG